MKVALPVRVEIDTKLKLKNIAKNNDSSVSKLVNKILTEFTEKYYEIWNR